MEVQAITAEHVFAASQQAGCDPSELFERAAKWRRLTPAHATMAHRHFGERNIVATFMGDFINGGHHLAAGQVRQ